MASGCNKDTKKIPEQSDGASDVFWAKAHQQYKVRFRAGTLIPRPHHAHFILPSLADERFTGLLSTLWPDVLRDLKRQQRFSEQ